MGNRPLLCYTSFEQNDIYSLGINNNRNESSNNLNKNEFIHFENEEKLKNNMILKQKESDEKEKKMNEELVKEREELKLKQEELKKKEKELNDKK